MLPPRENNGWNPIESAPLAHLETSPARTLSDHVAQEMWRGLRMFMPWIELARESAQLAGESVQLAVRLTKAWGAAGKDPAGPLESWKIISADANEAGSAIAPKVRKVSKVRKSTSRAARTASKRAAASHRKSKVARGAVQR
jgi:hypothetical protein